MKISSKSRGFTLVETLIAIGIFIIIATAIYFSYSNLLEIFSASYLNLTALSALDNELEIIHNMAYSDIGIVGGSPSGIIQGQKNIVYGNIPFVVNTTIRNVDDPYDGLQGGSPNDTAPADYKLVEVEITCTVCPRFIPARVATTIAPLGLETITNNGTLLIKVINASGQPIAGANVSVINNLVSPPINISDVTDVNGLLRLVDIPPSSAGYKIVVSKSAYSSDRTYTPGDILNPNPLKPDVTVLSQKTTEISFVIDRVSTLNMRTQNKFCTGMGNIDFLQTGQKLIGTNPDVSKYSISNSTNANGDIAITGLDFDTYSFLKQDASYNIAGFTPLMPIAIDPNGAYGLTWLMEAISPSSIVVTAKNGSGQLINDAKVTISRTGFSAEEYTARKYTSYSDWSSGQYNSKSSYLDASNVGELRVGFIGSKYATMSDEWLISQTIDFGTSNTNFYNLDLMLIQPAQTSVKVQLATNDDNATWNYIGPDGTVNSYYNLNTAQIHSSHNGKRYLRYKIVLRTDDENNTPTFQDLKFNFHSSCIPDGQVYFNGLTQNTYTIIIEKSGYQTFSDTAVIIDENWEDYRAILQP